MPIDSNDAFVAEGGYQYDFLAIPGSKPPPRYGYATQTWGDNPRFPVGGSFHGYYYGVVGSGGYSWYEGGKTGPEVNQYSGYAGVLGTGIYVNGVAGTSLNNVGVYGQVGEIPETSIPPGMTPATTLRVSWVHDRDHRLGLGCLRRGGRRHWRLGRVVGRLWRVRILG